MRFASIVGFALMVAALVALVLRHALLSRSPFAIVFQVAAVALMIWARITFGRRSFHAGADPTAGGLVTTGPYRAIRHPIYTAVCLFAWAGIFANLSAYSVLVGLVLTAGAIVRIFAEERVLVQEYPDYAQYAQRTKRMVPFVF
jgi:protein-S-isoprenylcysteine O-methyltransferase Ste14